ncbi:MAG: aminoglycoside phosphotransferase family protein [Bacteroidota bacterium]
MTTLIDNPEALLQYCQGALPQYDVLGPPQALSGGLLNYVWRIPARPSSFIAKQSPPYIASAPLIEMDASRNAFEARALQWGEKQSKLFSEAIRMPHFLHVDDKRSLLLMEDVGQGPDLGQWLAQTHPKSAYALGAKLGSFLARLHSSSLDNPQLAQDFDNQPVQQVRLELQYNLGQALREAQIPRADQIDKRIRQVGRAISQPGICLIMGDLWPPSLLKVESGLRIIDWEFAHYGWPVQDVAHLAAHLWMHQHMASTHDHKLSVINCLFSFLETYFAAFGERLATLEDRNLYFVHVGAEILARTIGDFQNGYLYADCSLEDQQMRDAVDFAVQCIVDPPKDSAWGIFFTV